MIDDGKCELCRNTRPLRTYEGTAFEDGDIKRSIKKKVRLCDPCIRVLKTDSFTLVEDPSESE